MTATKNRFEALQENFHSKNGEQIYHKAPPQEEFTLADIMREIRDIKIRQDKQEDRQTLNK